MDSLTTTIKREFLDQIVSGRKKIEYREIKPYWTKRLAAVRAPFLLRLINGMSATAPEATVEISRVVKNNAEGCYELHIARIIEKKNMGSVRPNRSARAPSDSKVERTNAYFFLWNPDQDTESFKNLDTILAEAKVGRAYTRYWRCPSKQPRVGDIAYLQRTGKTNNGVFARGTVEAAPIEEPHDGVRRVKLRLNGFLPLGYEIPRSEIVDKASFPAHWGPYASGNKIPARILGAIEEIWDARIPECFGSYPAGSG